MSASTRKKSQSSSDRLPTKRVKDIKRHRSFVIYGRSGTGKTTFAGTFPGPILYLDVKDEGTDSISDVDDLEVMEIEDLDMMEDTYWWLKKNPGEYKTIVIDTVSQLQQMAVEDVASRKKKKTTKRAGDWGSMTKQDWGEVAGIMKELLINFRDLASDGTNIVFIAQDRTFNFDEEADDEQVLAPEVGPALSPSVARTLNAAVTMIGNTFIRSRRIKKEVNGKKKTIEKIEYCLRIGPNPVYVTKVRKAKSFETPDVIVDPTYEDVMEVINGEY